jgi:hypothetical protein
MPEANRRTIVGGEGASPESVARWLWEEIVRRKRPASRSRARSLDVNKARDAALRFTGGRREIGVRNLSRFPGVGNYNGNHVFIGRRFMN